MLKYPVFVLGCMSSTRRAAKRVQRRLEEYSNVHASDIDVTMREDPVMSTIGFYFESLNDGSEDAVPTLSEWRRSSIVVMDGRFFGWTLHLPMIHPPYDADEIEQAWESSYEEVDANIPVIFYVSEYDGVAVPHVDTPESVWGDEDVDFAVADFFDELDSVVSEFVDVVYQDCGFGQ